MGLCNTINCLRYIIGIFGSISIAVTAYFYINNYDSFNCGNLKQGIGLGMTSLVAFVLSTIMYCSSCINKIFIPISALVVIISFIYNLYLIENLNPNCKSTYQKTQIWDYYNYLVISMGIISILSVIFMIIALYKKKPETINYEVL